jgi:uncharacterized protein (TIGR00369 family)
MQFHARPEFFTPFGTIQGGILTAMLDIVLGNVVTMNLDIPRQVLATLEIKVNFISPARGQTLIGEGHLSIKAARSILWRAAYWTQPGHSLPRPQRPAQ